MVVSKNAYLTMSEMQENASYIYEVLTLLGWTLNAIAGMLGNMETESTINPGIWQNLNPNIANGYGIVQWTPSTKYTDWLVLENKPDNLNSQLERIEYELDNNLQWIATSQYNFSFQDFKVSTQTPEYLADAFLKNYERPANQNQPNRATQARYWYDYLEQNVNAQTAQFPLDVLNITQGENGSYSHQGTWAMDFIGTTPLYSYFAPFDVECIATIPQASVVVWRSVNPVKCADGIIRNVVFDCIHEDTIWQQPSMTFPKGAYIGQTGTGGNATGDHVHMQAVIGETFQGFYTNPQGAISLIGQQIHLYDLFYIDNVTVINGMDYPWRTTTSPPFPPIKRSKGLIELWLSKALYTKAW